MVLISAWKQCLACWAAALAPAGLPPPIMSTGCPRDQIPPSLRRPQAGLVAAAHPHSSQPCSWPLPGTGGTASGASIRLQPRTLEEPHRLWGCAARQRDGAAHPGPQWEAKQTELNCEWERKKCLTKLIICMQNREQQQAESLSSVHQ